MEKKEKKIYRYPGLLSFEDSEISRKLFFGREQDIINLFYLILAEKSVILFSKSGIGKTSILNAGIFQRLREEGCYPIKIRLQPGAKAKEDDENNIPKNKANGNGTKETSEKIDELVLKEILSNPHPVNFLDDFKKSKTKDIWEFFKICEYRDKKNRLLTPVLFFDQFEEIFTLFDEGSRNDLIGIISELILGKSLKSGYINKDSKLDMRPPNVKLVFSLKENYLANMEEFAKPIPVIFHHRYRLTPLTRKQAEDAIAEPAIVDDSPLLKTSKFTFDSDAVDYILDFLTESKTLNDPGKTDEIEPFQLQIICQDLELGIDEKSDRKITLDDVKTDKGSRLTGIIDKFYSKILDDINKEDGIKTRNQAAKLCEEFLISKDGQYRLSRARNELNSESFDDDLLEKLLDKRLIRCEHRLGQDYFELSHDTLIEPIYENYKEYKIKKEEERRKEEEQQRIELALVEERKLNDERQNKKRKKWLITLAISSFLLLLLLFSSIFLLIEVINQGKIIGKEKEKTEESVKRILSEIQKEIKTTSDIKTKVNIIIRFRNSDIKEIKKVVDSLVTQIYYKIIKRTDFSNGSDILTKTEPYKELNDTLKNITFYFLNSYIKDQNWEMILKLYSSYPDTYFDTSNKKRDIIMAKELLVRDMEIITDSLWEVKKYMKNILVESSNSSRNNVKYDELKVNAYIDQKKQIQLIIYNYENHYQNWGVSSRYYYDNGMLYYSSKKRYRVTDRKEISKQLRYFLDEKLIQKRNSKGEIIPDFEDYEEEGKNILGSAKKFYDKAQKKL